MVWRKICRDWISGYGHEGEETHSGGRSWSYRNRGKVEEIVPHRAAYGGAQQGAGEEGRAEERWTEEGRAEENRGWKNRRAFASI